jgi:hypothetical protein
LKRSTIAFAPKQVASTSALKIRGASLARLRLMIAPFNNWSASGVRRPLSQSIASSSCSFSGILAASSDNFAMIFSASSSLNTSSTGSCFNGQLSKFLNHAYTSPKALWPASIPIIPGIIEPGTWPQIPFTSFPSTSACGATSISQVEVPITLLK